MKIKLHAYRLHNPSNDKKGNWDVVVEPSDSICVSVGGEGGGGYQFDSYEAYHVYEWAKDRGLTVEKAEPEIELPD